MFNATLNATLKVLCGYPIKPTKVHTVAYAIGVMLGSWNFSSNIFSSQHGIDWIVASGKLGVALRNQYPPTTLIATPHIGALGYYSTRPLLDILGLTDKYIASAFIVKEI